MGQNEFAPPFSILIVLIVKLLGFIQESLIEFIVRAQQLVLWEEQLIIQEEPATGFVSVNVSKSWHGIRYCVPYEE